MAFAPAAMAAEVRNILVLYSNGRLVPGNVEVERGLRTAIESSSDRPVQIFSEFLDTPEFGGEAYERTMTAYLRDKYAGHRPDIVIGVAKPAFAFLQNRRADLFRSAPLVHAAVVRSYLQSLPPLAADVVGVPIEYDAVGTIEQALRWHPKARHLVIVTGATTRDREWEALLRQAVQPFSDRVRIEFLAALPTPAVLRRLGELTSDAVVFTPGYYQGADELRFTPRDSAQKMAQASASPLYGPLSTFIGTGAVGGRAPSFEAVGQRAGQIVNALLSGAAPTALDLPAVMPSELNVDWRQTRRWGIDDDQLPAGTVVHFKEPGFWEQYRTAAILVAAIVVLQGALIARLLFERRRRHAAELAVQKQRSELAHTSRLAIAGELTASIAHEINQPLAAILTNAEAAEILLGAATDRRDELKLILADIRRDDLRARDVIHRLRALLAKQSVTQQAFELNEAASEATSLLGAEARRREVTLDVRTATVDTGMLGDPIQIQQVIINLVLNAMDAVADAPPERRSILVAVDTHADGVGVAVHDRGHGVAAEHLPRLFDSFFSTKSRGMGLGLSIARTIVEAHGGRIWAENATIQGTTFRVSFPGLGERGAPSPVAA